MYKSFRKLIKEYYLKPKRALLKDKILLDKQPQLTKSIILNTRVLMNREHLLETIGKLDVIAEVGVATGEFSSEIIKICSPKKLYLIDAWMMRNHPQYGEEGLQVVQKKFKQDIAQGRIEILKGMSFEMLQKLPDYQLDFIYIDASHDYESVKKDLEIAKTKVKENGIIAGHDYVRWAGHAKRFGVVEAVNEFCIENNYELLFLTVDIDNNSSYALKKCKS